MEPDDDLTAELALAPISLTSETAQELQALEEALWQEKTRYDDAWLKQHLHPEFIEFGRSGRVYTYDSFFPAKGSPIDCLIPLPNFTLVHQSRSVALVTYESHVRYGDTLECAHRASTWLHDGDCWRLRFHQGTAFPARH